ASWPSAASATTRRSVPVSSRILRLWRNSRSSSAMRSLIGMTSSPRFEVDADYLSRGAAGRNSARRAQEQAIALGGAAHVDPPAREPELGLIAVVNRIRMAGLARWQNEAGAHRRAGLDGETQRCADRLGVRIGVAVETDADGHAVAGGRQRADAEERFEQIDARKPVVLKTLVQSAPAPTLHVRAEFGRERGARTTARRDRRECGRWARCTGSKSRRRHEKFLRPKPESKARAKAAGAS